MLTLNVISAMMAKSKRLVLSFCILPLLAGCGGPLSVLPYMASVSLGAYATHKNQERAEQKKYVDKCLPTERPINALLAGIYAEREANHLAAQATALTASQEKRIEAYVYYRIAETLDDTRAHKRIIHLRQFMTADMRAKANKEFKKYTLENILSCYTLTAK